MVFHSLVTISYIFFMREIKYPKTELVLAEILLNYE